MATRNMKGISNLLAIRSPRWNRRKRRELLVTCVCVGFSCVFVTLAILYMNGQLSGWIHASPSVSFTLAQ